MVSGGSAREPAAGPAGGLIGTRRFGPLFVTQFLGAFNDNLFKTAFIFLVTYHLRRSDPAGAAWAATLAAAVFVLPFVLFSGTAGSLADARDKAMIARGVKIAEIAFMALGAAALWQGSEGLGLAVIALMGLHSTVFGPVKYAILPQHLGAHELVQGTGLVEGATFVAILLGQIAGGLLPPPVAGLLAIGVALAGWLASRFIPPAPPEAGSRFAANPLRATGAVMAGALASREVTIATLAISWFWALGAIYTSQFVPLAHAAMGGSEGVATLFLAAFSIGIAAGSVAAHRLTRGAVSTRLVPWAAAIMALAGVDLWWAGVALGPGPRDVAAFLADPGGWRVLADLLAMAVAGGLFSVPLYAVLQTATGAGQRAGAIAANNIVNSLFQVVGVLAIGAVVNAGAGLGLALAGTAATALLLVPILRLLPR